MPSGRFITLRVKQFGDSDLIVDVLSKQGERLSLTAKNARKSRRRFAGGVLEALQFIELYYMRSKAGYLYIQEAKLVDAFSEVRNNYQKLQVGFSFLQLISKATQEGLQDNKQLFDLLGNSLKALERSDQLTLLKTQFQLKYLFYLGFSAIDEDSEEFITKPIGEHASIRLTDDELTYMSQYAHQQIRTHLATISESTP